MKLPRFKLVLLFSSLLLFFCYSFLKPELASAALNWGITQNTYEKTLEATPTESLETFQARTFLYYLHNLNLGISGSSRSSGGGGIKNQNQLDYAPGAIQLAGGYISQIVAQPPASSIEYLADIGSRLKLVSPAYAQEGIGYQGLTGVLPLWKAFRNIAYAFFVIIFVVVGFMIMFRAKLNPQTAVNLQLALPKLVVTLLLITFSYAIAGLVLDLVYLSIYLVVNITNSFVSASEFNARVFISGNLIDLFKGFNVREIVNTFGTNLGTLINGILEGTGMTGQLIEGASGILAIPIIKLIVGAAILFSIIKLLFQLIIAYINIILQVIFSPIMLLFNALPAGNSFSSWLKNLLANAAAFPTAVTMILIGSALINPATSRDSSIGKTFAPPLLNFFDADSGQNLVTSIIGLGIILLLPKTVQIIQEALKAKPAIPAAAAVAGALIGTPLRIASGGIQYVQRQHEMRVSTRAQSEQIAAAINTKRAKETGKT